MDFTFNEKQAVVSVEMAMAQADGVIDRNELAYFEQLEDYLQLSVAQLHDVIATIDDDYSLLGLVTISKMTAAKKADVKQMLLHMMTSDSDLHPKELALFNFIGRVTGLDAAADSLKGGHNGKLDYDPARVLEGDKQKALTSAEKKLLGSGTKKA